MPALQQKSLSVSLLLGGVVAAVPLITIPTPPKATWTGLDGAEADKPLTCEGLKIEFKAKVKDWMDEEVANGVTVSSNANDAPNAMAGKAKPVTFDYTNPYKFYYGGTTGMCRRYMIEPTGVHDKIVDLAKKHYVAVGRVNQAQKKYEAALDQVLTQIENLKVAQSIPNQVALKEQCHALDGKSFDVSQGDVEAEEGYKAWFEDPAYEYKMEGSKYTIGVLEHIFHVFNKGQFPNPSDASPGVYHHEPTAATDKKTGMCVRLSEKDEKELQKKYEEVKKNCEAILSHAEQDEQKAKLQQKEKDLKNLQTEKDQALKQLETKNNEAIKELKSQKDNVFKEKAKEIATLKKKVEEKEIAKKEAEQKAKQAEAAKEKMEKSHFDGNALCIVAGIVTTLLVMFACAIGVCCMSSTKADDIDHIREFRNAETKKRKNRYPSSADSMLSSDFDYVYSGSDSDICYNGSLSSDFDSEFSDGYP